MSFLDYLVKTASTVGGFQQTQIDPYEALDLFMSKAAFLKIAEDVAEETSTTPEEAAEVLARQIATNPEVAEKVQQAVEEEKRSMLSEIVEILAQEKVAAFLQEIGG